MPTIQSRREIERLIRLLHLINVLHHLSQCMIQANEQANSIVAAAAPDRATPSNSSETKERRQRYLLLAAPTAAAPTMGDGTNWRRLRRGTGANSIKSA